MNSSIFIRLSIMMFLEFFIWGAWYVTVGNYMAKSEMTSAIYWAYTVGPIAAMISPFFLGMVADRFFATERVLGVLQILGGIAIFASPFVAEQMGATAFIILLLAHMLCYMPTIGLTNTLAFHNLTNQEKQFPLIRVFGTIGWIVAGIVVSKVLHADETRLPLLIAGGAGVAMGIFSFTLPHTPPPLKGKKVTAGEAIGLTSLRQLSSVSFWIFIAASLLICIPLSAYYAYAPVYVNAAGIADPGFKMSFGQMSEVFFMLVMPMFFAFLGVKWMLAVGMLAWVVRYALFAAAATAAPDPALMMIVGGVILHGICYDFFFVTGYIYVDKKSTPGIRGQAQGFLIFVTLGVGMFLGALIAGWIFNDVVGDATTVMANWKQFWWIPTVFAGVILVLFALLFRDDTKRAVTSQGEVAEGALAEPNP